MIFGNIFEWKDFCDLLKHGKFLDLHPRLYIHL